MVQYYQNQAVPFCTRGLWMRRIKGLLSPRNRRVVVWCFAVFCYVFFQAVLYGQTPTRQSFTDTPWEHLTLEGALALAVAVQYRENRAKEAVARELATQAAQAIERATNMMADVTKALERLASKVEECPVKLGRN